MLKRILHELESAKGPVSLDELGTRLGVEREALEGMVQTLVRLGRLRDDRHTAAVCGKHCAGCDMAGSCADATWVPRTYSLVEPDETECR